MVTQLSKLGRFSVGIAGSDGKIVQASRKKKIVIINERGKK